MEENIRVLAGPGGLARLRGRGNGGGRPVRVGVWGPRFERVALRVSPRYLPLGLVDCAARLHDAVHLLLWGFEGVLKPRRHHLISTEDDAVHFSRKILKRLVNQM